jgi:hypothetical protein
MRVLTDEEFDKVSGGATPSTIGYGRNTAVEASLGSGDNYYNNGYETGYEVARYEVPTNLEPTVGTVTTDFGFVPPGQ